MKLVIDEAVRAKYPILRIGIVVAHSVDNSIYVNALTEYCNITFKNFAQQFEDDKVLLSLKNIVAWQNIYRSFGANPKKKKPTAESLLSRVIRSGFVPHISPAVDSYLVAEVIHQLPIGGYDLNKISGNIVLRISPGNEAFIGIGKTESDTTSEGEIIYADDKRVLTRRWNYNDCDFCRIDNSTVNLALFVEGPVEAITDNEISSTTNEIAKNLKEYCGAEVQELFINSYENEIVLL